MSDNPPELSLIAGQFDYCHQLMTAVADVTKRQQSLLQANLESAFGLCLRNVDLGAVGKLRQR